MAGLLFPGDAVTLLLGEIPVSLNRLFYMFSSFVGVCSNSHYRTCVLEENSIHEQAAHPTITIFKRVNANQKVAIL